MITDCWNKMGYGQEEQTRDQSSVEIVERGEIFFFYRPKVETEEAHSPDDVQRLYIVLRPESGEKNSVQEKQDSDSGKEGDKVGTHDHGGGGHGTEKVNVEEQRLFRLIVMGKKSLPNPSEKRGRPYWGFVELVTTRIEDVKADLKGKEYETATRGHRHTETARALAEGVYRILRHNPRKRNNYMHTHLVYKLEYPPEDVKNDAQESLNVEREGSFLIQIKNPDQKHGGGGRGFQSKRRAAFPAHLQGQFGNRQYNPADPPDFLNYEGCEFLLIAASDDIEEELGLELRTEVENSHDPSCSDLVQMIGESSSGSIRPLVEGTWA